MAERIVLADAIVLTVAAADGLAVQQPKEADAVATAVSQADAVLIEEE